MESSYLPGVEGVISVEVPPEETGVSIAVPLPGLVLRLPSVDPVDPEPESVDPDPEPEPDDPESVDPEPEPEPEPDPPVLVAPGTATHFPPATHLLIKGPAASLMAFPLRSLLNCQ